MELKYTKIGDKMWQRICNHNLPEVDEEGISTVSVLVTDGITIFEAFYSLDCKNGAWYLPIDWCEGCGTIIPIQPTHWMPKPSMPSV